MFDRMKAKWTRMFGRQDSREAIPTTQRSGPEGRPIPVSMPEMPRYALNRKMRRTLDAEARRERNRKIRAKLRSKRAWSCYKSLHGMN